LRAGRTKISVNDPPSTWWPGARRSDPQCRRETSLTVGHRKKNPSFATGPVQGEDSKVS